MRLFGLSVPSLIVLGVVAFIAYHFYTQHKAATAATQHRATVG